ncbi:aminoglycoside phosphotransferase family protein [Variovorax sp. OV329]|uniref:aminoglycoside phosphotransferase family protein n=1 Tax=Variovorax sp. OV329 TaxID=1882825 RepID=UPI0008E4F37E|nr:phosphotransferase [Variovorax sp. OV329]SFM30184.1 hypothetical protein SAMN05444747_104175 [Variovorax sp. OV329]
MTAPSTLPPGAAASTPISWSDARREQAFAGWLALVAPLHGLEAGTVRLASADASFRRYFRVDASGGTTRIVMDAPPDKENSEPFVKVAQLMAQAGVSAPQVLEWDRAQGFLLLDDLGRQTMLDVIDPAQPEAARPLYDAAIDALVRWQLSSRAGVLPAYDEALLRRELALFPDWYVAQHRGIAIEGPLAQTLARSFDQIVQNNLASPSVYVHRDFMPRNLMVHPDSGALGVLDFQDAVHGPITYDIASLMRDAFLSWEEEFVIDMTVRYWEKARKAGLPVDEDFGAFYRAVEWMGLQRHLKVAGIFARLTLRDGKPRYLADAPRFIGYIRATAGRYRELAPLLRAADQIEGIQAASGYAFGRV